MTALLPPDDEREAALIKYEGRPSESASEGEATLWNRFLAFFSPWAKKSKRLVARAAELAGALAEAEVSTKSNTAEKLAAEAADLVERKNLTRQETVRVVNEEIRKIFSQHEVPDAAKQLQLANLLSANPQIAEHLGRIEDLYDQLRLTRGFEAQIVQCGEPQALMDSGSPGSEDAP